MPESFYSRFSSYYHAIFPFRENVFRFLLGETPFRGCMAVDLGCGPGDYCRVFELEGYHAVGIDADEAMIQSASERYPGVNFICEDIKSLNSINRISGLVFCIGNVLSHLSNRDLHQWAGNLSESCLSGCKLVIQTVNWDKLTLELPYRFPVIEKPELGLRFQRDYIPSPEGRIAFKTRMEVNGKCLWSDSVPMYPILSCELQALLRKHNWELSGLWGGYDKHVFDSKHSPACIAVFKRL